MYFFLEEGAHARAFSNGMITSTIAEDHICALARTSSNKFVFMGGDAAHHGGEFRPSPYTPLPTFIVPSPLEANPRSHVICPGAFFEAIHPLSTSSGSTGEGGDWRTTPFYELAPHMNVSMADAYDTLQKMQVFDASEDVFVVIAHDASLMGILPMYPEELGWEGVEGKEGGDTKTIGRWRFLRDFVKGVEAVQAREETKE